LPIFERLGEVRLRAITLAQIANALAAKHERREAYRYFSAALESARALKTSEAEQIATMMRTLGFAVPGETTLASGVPE
jgi:hypothetical protein